MEISLLLGKVIALFMIIMALYMIIKKKSVMKAADVMWKDEAGLVYMSTMTLIVGLLLVVSHKVWTADWRIIITIFGWAVLIKAVCVLFFPEKMKKLAKMMSKDSYILVAAVLWFAIGLYLLMNVL